MCRALAGEIHLLASAQGSFNEIHEEFILLYPTESNLDIELSRFESILSCFS